MTAKIKLNAASGGGSFSLQAPSSSSNNRVMTLPDTADGTILTTTNPKAGNIIQVLETARLDASSHSISAGGDFNPTFLRQSITTTGSNRVIIEGFLTCSLDVGTNWIGITLRRDNSDITASVGVASGNKRRASCAGFNHDDENMVTEHFISIDQKMTQTVHLVVEQAQ